MQDAFYTYEHQRHRLDVELEQTRAGTMLRLWMFRKEDTHLRKIIGDVHLSHIVRGVMHSCFLGYKTDQSEINKGYMTEALEASIRFAFEDLKLHRIEAGIMPRNIASQRVVEKLGFEREGLSRRYIWINGVWEDHLRYALLNEKE